MSFQWGRNTHPEIAIKKQIPGTPADIKIKTHQKKIRQSIWTI